MAGATSIPARRRKSLKSAGKRSNYHGDVICVGPIDRRALLIGPAGGAEPEISNLRIVRILGLVLLVALLLPYLVTPFYRTGHPVSALMAWRWLKGAPMSRSWINFSGMSPHLA